VNCFEVLGLLEHLETLKEWAKTRAVILRFRREERCEFVKKTERKVESPSVVTERSGFFGNSTTSSKVVTTVTDYHWQFDAEYELVAFQGNDPTVQV
jgi:hypothetical protein